MLDLLNLLNENAENTENTEKKLNCKVRIKFRGFAEIHEERKLAKAYAKAQTKQLELEL